MQQPTGGRISRGWRLVKISWSIVRAEKGLIMLPIVSFVCLMLVWGGLVAAAVGLGGVPKTAPDGSGASGLPPVDYVLIALGYLVGTFVTVFFNAAVIGVATIRLRGGDPKLKDGFRLASTKLPKILGWSVLTATVGLVLRSLEERAGLIGRIVIAIVGVAWAVVTFFVVPVLLYEDLGVIASVKRSAGLFKQRWGEQFTGNVSIGLVLMLVSLPVIVVCVAVTVVLPVLGIALMVVAVGALMGVGGAMSGVFNAALYQYATDGLVAGGFTETDLQAAFRPRKGGRFLG